MKVGLLGIPFDDNSSFERGPAKAPQVIRNTLSGGSLNSGCENGQNLKDNPLWHDCGDLTLIKDDDFVESISEHTDTLLQQGFRLLTLGGDHSISYPLLRGYARHYPNLTIVHIDAHSDLYDSFKGNRLSNACPFARVMEEGLCSRLVQFGIRTLNAHQVAQAERFGVEMYQMKDWPLPALPKIEGPVYLSLDVDGIDPAFAPGVSHREPGGLSTREVINLIHTMEGKMVGADLVEFNPLKDIDNMTAQLSGKLLKELAGVLLAGLES